MTTPLDTRDAASHADQQLLTRQRADAARRALHEPAPQPGDAAGVATEAARIVVDASTHNIDVDRIGEQLHVFDDRVQLVDRHGQPIRSITRDELTAVKVRKRLKNATLTLRADDGVIAMKGLDPVDAERVRDDLLGLGDRPAKASDALAQLDALAANGLLDDKDLAAKRSQLLRQARPGT